MRLPGRTRNKIQLRRARSAVATPTPTPLTHPIVATPANGINLIGVETNSACGRAALESPGASVRWLRDSPPPATRAQTAKRHSSSQTDSSWSTPHQSSVPRTLPSTAALSRRTSSERFVAPSAVDRLRRQLPIVRDEREPARRGAHRQRQLRDRVVAWRGEIRPASKRAAPPA